MKHVRFIQHSGSHMSGETASFPDGEADILVAKKKAVLAPLHESHHPKVVERAKNLTAELETLKAGYESEEDFKKAHAGKLQELADLEHLVRPVGVAEKEAPAAEPEPTPAAPAATEATEAPPEFEPDKDADKA